MHVTRRRSLQARGIAQQRLQMMRLTRRQSCRGMQVSGDPDARMLLQVLPDARTIGLHGDAMLGEMRSRTDPAAHQHNGALQGARGYNDLASLDGKPLAT